MLSYRLGTVNDFYWEFKPVLSYSKPHTFPTFFGEEKELKNAFNLSNQRFHILIITSTSTRLGSGTLKSKLK